MNASLISNPQYASTRKSNTISTTNDKHIHLPIAFTWYIPFYTPNVHHKGGLLRTTPPIAPPIYTTAPLVPGYAPANPMIVLDEQFEREMRKA